jgi:hypothetical protein
VTIFNGDWDACVPYTDGQGWTEGERRCRCGCGGSVMLFELRMGTWIPIIVHGTCSADIRCLVKRDERGVAMYGLSRGVCSLKCYGTRLLHLTLTQPRAARTMSGMGYKVKDAWHHWTYTSTAGYADQVAGYATNYDVSSLGNVRVLQCMCTTTVQ